jgi:tRNA (cytidine/uridine-2'-O-)-methyltransferase
MPVSASAEIIRSSGPACGWDRLRAFRTRSAKAGRPRERISAVFRIVFFHPEIPGNTGNAIRLAANTGCELHLIEPLGFSLEDRYLRRAGLDYHDLAHIQVHRDLDAAWQALDPVHVYAFTTQAHRRHTDVDYAEGDVLLFGPESVGLPDEVLADERITDQVRLPMLPTSRSLNLTNTAAIAVYEAWRQHDFRGSARQSS